MQVLSKKSPTSKIKEPKTPDLTERSGEKEWEGFGEEESGKQIDTPRSKGKDLVGKDTRKSEKKRGKQDEEKKSRAASQPTSSENTFKALGTADESNDRADDDEGDGKQRWMVERFLLWLSISSFCVGFPTSVLFDGLFSLTHEVLAANCDTAVYHPRNPRWPRRHRQSTDWIWQDAGIRYTYLRALP